MAVFRPGLISKGYKVGGHIHDTLNFQFVLQGVFRFETDKQSIVLQPGHGIIIPRERNHRWSCNRPGVLFGASILVAGPMAMDFTNGVERQSAGSFLPCSSPELMVGLLRIMDLALMPAPFHWRREMIAAELHLWLARALHTAVNLSALKTPVPYHKKAQTDPSRRLCEEAVRFIRSNFNRPFGIREAARHAGITPRHLNRLFHEFLHDTPHAFLLRIRLEHANTMLKSSPALKIKEIAFATGFRNPSHFTQCFRRHFGRSPARRP